MPMNMAIISHNTKLQDNAKSPKKEQKESFYFYDELERLYIYFSHSYHP